RDGRLIALDVPELKIAVGRDFAGERGEPHGTRCRIIESDKLDAAAFLRLQRGDQLDSQLLRIELRGLNEIEANGNGCDRGGTASEAAPEHQAIPEAGLGGDWEKPRLDTSENGTGC